MNPETEPRPQDTAFDPTLVYARGEVSRLPGYQRARESVAETKPSDGSRSFFRELSPAEQQAWTSLFDQKLAAVGEFGATREQSDYVEKLLKEIVGRGNISPELFDAIVGEIVILPQDKKAANGHRYIGAARNGVLFLFPQFFKGPDQDNRFDPEHVIAHELGELAYAAVDDANQPLIDPTEYRAFKAAPPWAINGDYVDSESPEHQEREEWAETMADFLRSTTAAEMFARRMERVQDPSKKRALSQSLATREGEARFDYLMQETYFLRASFERTLADLAQRERHRALVANRIDAQRSASSEDDFLDSMMWLPDYGLPLDRANLMAPPRPTKKSRGFFGWILDLLGMG